jgi:hypothetical protein
VCAFARCAKSNECRGGGRCLEEVDVPEPVFARATWLMLAARLPWITSGRANERIAYEAWCAAMESRLGAARTPRNASPSAHQTQKFDSSRALHHIHPRRA